MTMCLQRPGVLQFLALFGGLLAIWWLRNIECQGGQHIIRLPWQCRKVVRYQSTPCSLCVCAHAMEPQLSGRRMLVIW